MTTVTPQEALKELGYSVTFRHNAWRECLVSGSEDVWTGQGLDNDAALEDALRTMLPSRAARRAFDEYSKALYLVRHPEPQVKTPTPEPAKPKKDNLVVYDRTNLRVTEPPPAPAPKPQVQPETGTYVDPSLADEKEEPDILLTEEEARTRLREIAQEIVDDRGELAVMASHFQKLNVASWIFQARSIEEQFPKHKAIAEDVHQIALMLTVFCKEFWPGSVQALQVYTAPRNSLEGLVKTKTRPETWAEAAAILEEAVDEMGNATGQDAYGWHDSHLTNPPPPSPSKVLAEAVELIERVVGPVDEVPDKKSIKNVKMLASSYAKELLHAARLLRWSRTTCKSPILWGMAYGKLRWLSRFRISGTDKLSPLLDPRNCPPKKWSEVLGRDPAVIRQNRLRAKVMADLPDASWGLEKVMEWLTDAFPVFTNPQLAKMTDAVHDSILELEVQDFADADRSVRSRFKKLQAMIQAQEDLSEVDLPEVSSVEAEEEDDEEDQEDPISALLENVRKITEGKRMLFVSNRNDKTLQKKLEEDLACDVVLKDGGSSSKMRSVLDSVSKGSYDLILMATGFNNHSADAILCRTAKQLDVPYVRVNKGRPLATARAIARAFNLQVDGNNQANASAAHVG